MSSIVFPEPIALKGAAPLRIEAVLRYLPGKRLVVRVRQMEKCFVAKLFLANTAHKKSASEQKVYQQLCQAQLPTPSLLWAGQTETFFFEGKHQCVDVILFEYITPTTACEVDETLITFLVKQHKAGVYQTDCHVQNYLKTTQQLYLIDLGSIRLSSQNQALSQKVSLQNLAQYFAQMGRVFEDRQRQLLQCYCDERGWLCDRSVVAQTERAFEKSNRALYRERLSKVQRSSSEFDSLHLKNGRAIVRRDRLGSDLTDFLHSPDKWVEKGEWIKAGNSNSIVKVYLDDRLVVIKRYNLKTFWHRLKRAFQQSRARRAWVNAYRLAHLQIETPQAIALLERVRWGLTQEAYLVTHYEAGVTLQHYLKPPQWTVEKLSQIYASLCYFFEILKRYRLVHGDLKATNLLVQGERVLVTDLDSLRETWRHSKKDAKRFLKNWRMSHTLLCWFALYVVCD